MVIFGWLFASLAGSIFGYQQNGQNRQSDKQDFHSGNLLICTNQPTGKRVEAVSRWRAKIVPLTALFPLVELEIAALIRQ